MKWQPNDVPVRDRIISAAVKEAERVPLNLVTRGRIAKRAAVTASLVSYYTGTMEELRTTIVERAVETNNLPVIAQAIAAHHPGVKKLSDSVRAEALKTLR